MERDFLGLNSRQPLTTVKEKINSDGFKEKGFCKSSGIQQPFSNKVSAPPHLMSFKVVPEDKTKKISSDLFASQGFLSIATASAYEPSLRDSKTEKKSYGHDRPGGSPFSLTAYPLHQPRDMKMFPVSNSGSSPSMSNFFSKDHRATTCWKLNPAMKPELFGGAAISAPQTALRPVASVAGTTESCARAKAPQLTIIYAGTVNVFDNISPEKAQAIMSLAGDQSLIASSNFALQNMQVKAPNPAASDVNVMNQSITTPPRSCLPSPLSISSHTNAHSGSGSTSTEDMLTAKTARLAAADIGKLELPKSASAIGSVASLNMIPSVPQARKASLTRFLEKRKERVISAAPYNLSKNPELPPQKARE